MSARRIVVGYDGSAHSETALTWALERAGRRGRVIVVHASRHQPGAMAGPLQRLRDEDPVRAEAVVEQVFLERDDVYDHNVGCDVLDEAPAQALVHAARLHDADEIVVGRRPRGRLGGPWDSVSQEIVRLADRPVVVVP